MRTQSGWRWLRVDTTPEAITLDLEEMRAKGIEGAILYDSGVGGRTNFSAKMVLDGKGYRVVKTADYAGGRIDPIDRPALESWTPHSRELVRFAAKEAGRLGIKLCLTVGLAGTSGPIAPEYGQQKLVWSETAVTGPQRFDAPLSAPDTEVAYTLDPPPAPKPQRMRPKSSFPNAHPIAVLAVPDRDRFSSAEVVDLSNKTDAAGRMRWDVPAGAWRILRFGYTPTGAKNVWGTYTDCLSADRGDNIGRGDQMKPRPALPAEGYDHDNCNLDGLLTRVGAEKGRLVLPDGMSYRMLVLPDSSPMPLEALEKIATLVKAGATVVGPPPAGLAGLAGLAVRPDAQVKFDALVAQLWGRGGGSGVVRQGVDPAEVLKELRVPPDVEFSGLSPAGELDWIHRHTDDAEIYFVASRWDTPEKVDCTFRVGGRQPELWDPVTGQIRPAAAFSQRDGRISVPLEFNPRGSVFVVFRRPIAPDAAGTAASNYPRISPMEGWSKFQSFKGRAWRPRRALTGLVAWGDQDEANGFALDIFNQAVTISTAIRRTSGRRGRCFGSAARPVFRCFGERREKASVRSDWPFLSHRNTDLLKHRNTGCPTFSGNPTCSTSRLF